MSPNRNVSQYEHYFDSGTYDRRYPLPNLRVMALLEGLLRPDGVVLDYGCGSGRYLMPLGEQVRLAIGFDICSAALATVKSRVSVRTTHRYVIAGPGPDDLADAVGRHGPVDLALCLFGVLAHIDTPGKRQQTLQTLRTALRRDNGRLMVSVPNRLRRFRDEQRQYAGQDQITYVRQTPSGPLELTYRLYDAGELKAELESAGFVVDCVLPESLLPESAISRFPWLGRIDRLLSRLVPARFGYGLLAIARPDRRPEAG